MRPALTALLLLGIFCFASPTWADSISPNAANNPTFTFDVAVKNGFAQGFGQPDLAENENGGFEGASTPAGAAFDCFAIDPSFDFPQSDPSEKHQISFVSNWNDDHGWGSAGDSFGIGWWWDHDGDHDRDDCDPGLPSVPAPEPESLWLFLTGMGVVGLCSILRRTMPTIRS